MKHIVLKFGLIAGGILAVFTGVLLPFALSGENKVITSEIFGYSVMIMACLAIFFGIRRYREEVGGGAITFGRGIKVGTLIALIASVMFVAAWQIAYWNFIPDFAERYAADELKKMEEKGASAAEIAKKKQSLDQFAQWYKNPFLNVAVTFLEVFPVGFLVTLISAAILRRKRPADVPEAVPV